MRKALFLDRDGVINVEQCYVHSRDAFRFQEGIFELCRAAQTLGYTVVVVTNQAGIARGFYTESDFLDLTQWMVQEFEKEQIQVERVYYCPYHPIHGVGEYKRDSPDRKPNPGMILREQADLDLDLASSVLIGDNLSDICAGKRAGIGTTILLRCGVAEEEVGEAQYYLSDSLEDIRFRFFGSVTVCPSVKEECRPEPLGRRT
jgi:D-glycero-D-manno-heptose 1,7-bisphosphate phosphatase